VTGLTSGLNARPAPHGGPRRATRARMTDDIMHPAPVRAPDFPATLDWLHTGGRALTLADFRGKILFLDFWTYG